MVGIVLAVCLVGGAGGGFWLWRSAQNSLDPAQAATDEFLASLERADYPAGYGLLCESTRQRFTAEEFAQYARSQPRPRSHTVVDASLRTVDRTPTALVIAEVHTADNAVDRHTFSVVQQGKAWRICGQPY